LTLPGFYMNNWRFLALRTAAQTHPHPE
jgi:hypothetical protein